jgi:FKBP-type peptidyl-prolyl cis-trans isomerase SlyD
MRTLGVLALGLTLWTLPSAAMAEETATKPAIKDGSRVSIEYTLTDDGGTVLDSNKGQAPFAFTQGAHEIVRGLETALLGLHVGDARKVTVKPEDAYGAVDPAAQVEVGRDKVPADVKVGSELIGRSSTGQTRAVRVKEIKDNSVVLDLNHPLAGKTLVFDVLILAVDGP